MAGLFDYEFQLQKINQHQPPLQKLNKVINWEMFREPIETALHIESKAPGGRPPYDKLLSSSISNDVYTPRVSNKRQIIIYGFFIITDRE